MMTFKLSDGQKAAFDMFVFYGIMLGWGYWLDERGLHDDNHIWLMFLPEFALARSPFG